MYGSILASTLSSLALSGAMRNVNSLHVVFADQRGHNLSLIYNMRHMRSVHTQLVSQHHGDTRATYHAALAVPDTHGRSDLPSIVIEDDVWFTDNFPARLTEVVHSAMAQSWGKPFFVSLYAVDSLNINTPDKVRAKHDASQQQASGHKAAAPGAMTAQRIGFGCCTQAVLFSNGDLRRQVGANFKRDLGASMLSDMVLRNALIEHNIPQYYPSSTLVQHTGTSSALFNEPGTLVNPRFHRAPSFPFVERYVTDDDRSLWVA
jgi:hypothetical protein